MPEPENTMTLPDEADPEDWGAIPERMFTPPGGDRPQCPHCMGRGYLTEETATVGSLILFHRRRIKMTQDELASKTGISRPQIANIESGRHDPPISRLRAFAEALGVKAKDLVP